jgi:hypothetical protein
MGAPTLLAQAVEAEVANQARQADTCHHRALWQMAVTHKALVAIPGLEVSMHGAGYGPTLPSGVSAGHGSY